MRRVTGSEVKKNWDDIGIDMINAINVVQQNISYKNFYSKFRAYLFTNTALGVFSCIILIVLLLKSGEDDIYPVIGFFLIAAVGCVLICRALWKGVAKKVPENARKVVFRGFVLTGICIMGKMLLCGTIILIPLAVLVGGGYDYGYRYVDEGENAGNLVLMRYKLNGQLEDVNGKVYEE